VRKVGKSAEASQTALEAVQPFAGGGLPDPAERLPRPHRAQPALERPQLVLQLLPRLLDALQLAEDAPFVPAGLPQLLPRPLELLAYPLQLPAAVLVRARVRTSGRQQHRGREQEEGDDAEVHRARKRLTDTAAPNSPTAVPTASRLATRGRTTWEAGSTGRKGHACCRRATAHG